MKPPIIWAGIGIFSAIPLLAQQTGSSPSQSSAPDVASMQQQIRDLQDRIISLEGQMRRKCPSLLLLPPDISVIRDFIGAVGNGTVPALAQQQPFPSMQMHESEIGLQAIIDPYTRGDFFISFGEQGVCTPRLVLGCKFDCQRLLWERGFLRYLSFRGEPGSAMVIRFGTTGDA
jgi:hypothetical protein